MKHGSFKVLLSIGGSSFSSNFSQGVSTPLGREKFSSSAVALVSNLGFDGIDLDWEYPADDAQANNLLLLLQLIRSDLDKFSNSLGPSEFKGFRTYHFELTVACSANPDNYRRLQLADMAPYVDFWNLMAYNYAGSWSLDAGYQANIWDSTKLPKSTPFNTETAVQYYTSNGVNASKIMLGMPVYGRSFEATDGLGQPFNGVGSGTWENGVYDYKALPLSGAVENHDVSIGSSYSYDKVKRQLITYDNVEAVKQKANWIIEMGLGGAVWWESSADRSDNNSLIRSFLDVIDPTWLDASTNWLEYPNSTYDNIRAMMGSTLSTSSLSQSSSSKTTHSSSSSSQSSSSKTTHSTSSSSLSSSSKTTHSTSASPQSSSSKTTKSSTIDKTTLDEQSTTTVTSTLEAAVAVVTEADTTFTLTAGGAAVTRSWGYWSFETDTLISYRNLVTTTITTIIDV